MTVSNTTTNRTSRLKFCAWTIMWTPPTRLARCSRSSGTTRRSVTTALRALEWSRAGFGPTLRSSTSACPESTGANWPGAPRRRGGDDILLVAVTALGDYRSLERMADSGFDLHFTKPVMPESIYAVLDDASAQLAEPRH